MLNSIYKLGNSKGMNQKMRLAVFADVHGNLPAFNALLADIKRCGDFDQIWCLGDLAAMGGQPHECIQLLLSLRQERGEDNFKIIGGNTDRYLVTGERLPFSRAKDPADFSAFRQNILSSNAVIAWNMMQLSWEDYNLLRSILGKELRQEIAGFGAVIGFHAVPGDDEALSLAVDSADEEAADALLDRAGRLALCGHTHRAMDRQVGSWRVINPGSVGMSFGNPGYAEWALLEWEDGALSLEFRRQPYDVGATLRQWENLGYPELDWIRPRLTT